MRVLDVDIETYSEVDLKSCGLYAYANDDSFEILMIAYAFDDEPISVIDLASPDADRTDWPALQAALVDPAVLKTAYNATFERTCLAAFLGVPMPPQQWSCTAVLAARFGLPGTLAGVGAALRLPAEDLKAVTGKNLIRYFCNPCVPTARNGYRTRNLPRHDPAKWTLFLDYCRQDVHTERRIRLILPETKTARTDFERRLWELDQAINDRGVRIDTKLVDEAVKMDEDYRRQLEAEAFRLTGLDNPGSVTQLKGWLERATDADAPIESLNKETVRKMIGETNDDTVRRVLEIRQKLGKTSIAKYQAMQRAICDDGRVHGLLLFYGANRTGRWAGRQVQIQNLPRNVLPDLDLARRIVKAGDSEALELIYGPPVFVLSQLIRTAFIPKDGCVFYVADFSAIEARVIAWLAGETWRMDVFNGHGKIYEASAARMFKVPIETIDKGSPLRQKGKIAELALGYQGAVGALSKMGALEMGLSEDELPGLVRTWRKANAKIVQLWSDIESAAFEAVAGNSATVNARLRFYCKNGAMYIRLPSGRELVYQQMHVSGNKLTYMGVGQERKVWGPISTYGGKLTENIVQAIARDCLAEAMIAVSDAGYDIAFHVHDEIIVEAEPEDGRLEEICGLMCKPISWAPGLPLQADGFQCDYYQKD